MPEINIDLSSFDIEKLKKYDQAYKFEKSTASYMEIIKNWELLGKEIPEFQQIAFQRAENIRKYYNNLMEYKNIVMKRIKKIKEIDEKLKEVLKLDIFTPQQKEELVFKFLGAFSKDIMSYYGSSELRNLIYKYQPFFINPCCNGEKLGFCYSDGSIAIDVKYDYAYPFLADITLIKLNNKWGFINKQGKEIVSPKYDDVLIGEAIESLMLRIEDIWPVSIDGNWGFVNKQGHEINMKMQNGLVMDWRL